MLSFLSAALLVLSTSATGSVISETHNLLLVKPDASDITPNILISPNRTISEPLKCANTFGIPHGFPY